MYPIIRILSKSFDNSKMNQLTTSKRAQVVTALVEGCSINSTVRMTGVAKHTILNLLKAMGCACASYHDRYVRNIRVRRVQADEVWSYVYGKDKNLSLEQVQKRFGQRVDVDRHRRRHKAHRFLHARRQRGRYSIELHARRGRENCQPHSANNRWSPSLRRCCRRCFRRGHRLCHASQDLRGVER